MKSKSSYEFGIKKTLLRSGHQILTPVCREKSITSFIKNKWIRIVKIYDNYLLMELDWEPSTLTEKDCEEHITQFRKQLDSQRANDITKIEVVEHPSLSEVI